MAGRHGGCRGGSLRTYSRHQPLQRVQAQRWLSPAEKRLFSSSSSPSVLSTSNEPTCSSDSDFRPPGRKKSVASGKNPVVRQHSSRMRRGRISQRGIQERGVFQSSTCRDLPDRKKKLVSRSKRKPRNLLEKSGSPSHSNGEDKENGVPTERVQSSLVLSTPFRKFVTIRRKSSVHKMHLRQKTEKTSNSKKLLTSVSPDSSYDFEQPMLRKRRRIHKDICIVLDSSMDVLHSPVQNVPLLSSTPSVMMSSRSTVGEVFQRQLSLFEGLQESVVRSSAEMEYPNAMKRAHSHTVRKCGDGTAQYTAASLDDSDAHGKACSPLRVRDDRDKYIDHIVPEKKRKWRQKLNSTLKSLTIEVTRRTGNVSPSLSLSPLHLPSESQSVICIDDEPIKNLSSLCHMQDGDILYASSELFSNVDCDEATSQEESKGMQVCNVQSEPPHPQSRRASVCREQAHENTLQYEASGDLKPRETLFQVMKDTNVPMSKCDTHVGSLVRQPFVSLDPKSVSKYFQQKNSNQEAFVETCENEKSKVQRSQGDSQEWLSLSKPDTLEKELHPQRGTQQTEPLSCKDTQQEVPLSLAANLNNKTRDLPSVSLETGSANKYFLTRRRLSQSRQCRDTMSGSDEPGFSALAVPTVTQTPDVHTSQMQSKLLGSVAPPPGTSVTGRKVCISGFSAKRWGNRPRKPNSLQQQQLSFRGDTDVPLQRCKADVSICSALSSSFLPSSSLLTSSFMNSSAVMDLSLSPDYLSVQDPQKDRQRWVRLRAALSLHRKKKVESAQLRVEPLDRTVLMSLQSPRNLNLSMKSSLLLLSPHSSLCVEELSDAEKVFAECQQDGPVSFFGFLTSDQLCDCQKIGEGVYGEVFKTLREEREVALKVIPIESSQKINGEDQKSFAEILPEIIISKELSLLSEGDGNQTSGFIRLHSAHCVQGSYPKELLQAWDTYAEEKGSENERPDVFDSEQLFMILEFEFGGNDLENMSCQLPSVAVSRSILHQVTAALAVAEEELRFEHRDLHWGNLLIQSCTSNSVTISLNGNSINIPSCGVQVKIIDYTLSRLDKDGLTVFCDLSSDEDLFLGEGDLQFDVYRSMRHENKNSWAPYLPHSNVLWLHYLADKLLSSVQYVKKPKSVAHRKELRKLQDFRREVQGFSSAKEALLSSKLCKL